MDLLHKECQNCGEKINKLQNPLNIFFLKLGKTLPCTKCDYKYKTSKNIYFMAFFYNWIVLLYIYSYIHLIEYKLLLLIFVLIEFAIILFLPFNKKVKVKVKVNNMHYLLTFLLTIGLVIVAFFLFMYIFESYDDYKFPKVEGEDDIGKAFFVIYGAIMLEVIILPIIIFFSNEFIKRYTHKQIDEDNK